MLLIDQYRRIRSIAIRNARSPFVREPLRNHEGRVRTLFAACGTDRGFVQALSEELKLCHTTVPLSLPYPAGLIDAAVRAIAAGTIGVASALPGGVAVTFDEDRPSDWYGWGSVIFASPAISGDFVAAALKIPANRQAFEAALAHPAGRRHAGAEALSVQDAAVQARRPADESAALAARGAGLLATRLLALVPRDPSRRRLRLFWVEHMVPLVPQSSAPPPSQRSAPAPVSSSTSPTSALPDAPGDVSPQAQTLIDAAQDGTPFCEECARRAAELANA